jgi:hypothetical protein
VLGVRRNGFGDQGRLFSFFVSEESRVYVPDATEAITVTIHSDGESLVQRETTNVLSIGGFNCRQSILATSTSVSKTHLSLNTNIRNKYVMS